MKKLLAIIPAFALFACTPMGNDIDCIQKRIASNDQVRERLKDEAQQNGVPVDVDAIDKVIVTETPDEQCKNNERVNALETAGTVTGIF